MDILTALVQLRDDIKLWCTNNFNNKLNVNLGSGNKFLRTDSSGKIVTVDSALTAEGVTATVSEINHLSGVTSGIQSQIDSKAASDHSHTAASVGADPSGSATAALTNAKSYADQLAATKANSTHSHAISDVSNLQSKLDSKSDAGHSHTASDVGADPVGSAATALSDAKSYTDGLVATKADSTHSHKITDVANLQSSLDGKASTEHYHTISYVTGLQGELDAKANKATTLTGYGITDAASKEYVDILIESLTAEGTADANVVQANLNAHTGDTNNPHATTLTHLGVSATATELNYMVGVTSKVQTQLDGKASSSHTHTAAAIGADPSGSASSALSSAKQYADQLAATKANSSHSHAIGDVTNLQTTLSGKADATHAHGISEVTDLQSSLDGKANSSHTHAISEVTNLQNSLDAKANKATTLSGYGITDAASKTYVDELIEGLTAEGTADANVVQANLNAHTGDTSNPHATTLSHLGVSATATELNYMTGVTSNVQDQLDGKAATSHGHAATSISSGTLSSSRLPTVPITKGGTGATTADAARTNLGAQGVHESETVVISASIWTDKNADIQATLGITADSTVIVSPAPESMAAYIEAGVYCSGQSEGILTFTCTSVPAVDLNVNVLLLP